MWRRSLRHWGRSLQLHRGHRIVGDGGVGKFFSVEAQYRELVVSGKLVEDDSQLSVARQLDELLGNIAK